MSPTLRVVLAILSISLPASGATWRTAGRLNSLGSIRGMGYVRNSDGLTRYNVILNVAVEQYAGGKRDRARDQQWFLQCDSHTPLGEEHPSCRLTRTALDHWGVDTDLGTVCNETNHSTSDGSLELLVADWEGGQLDFNIVHGDNSKTRVLIDMQYEGQMILLRNLTASITSRSVSGAATTLEYRVPQYTYVEQVPIVMGGMKDEWQRSWDEMVVSLTPADRAEWDRLLAARRDILTRVLRSFTKDEAGGLVLSFLAPDAAAQSADPVLKRAAELFIREVTAWLENSSMSSTGKTLVVNFLSKQ